MGAPRLRVVKKFKVRTTRYRSSEQKIFLTIIALAIGAIAQPVLHHRSDDPRISVKLSYDHTIDKYGYVWISWVQLCKN